MVVTAERVEGDAATLHIVRGCSSCGRGRRGPFFLFVDTRLCQRCTDRLEGRTDKPLTHEWAEHLLRCEIDGDEELITIDTETETCALRVSAGAPIAEALRGIDVGQTSTYKTPNGVEHTLTLIAAEPL